MKKLVKNEDVVDADSSFDSSGDEGNRPSDPYNNLDDFQQVPVYHPKEQPQDNYEVFENNTKKAIDIHNKIIYADFPFPETKVT